MDPTEALCRVRDSFDGLGSISPPLSFSIAPSFLPKVEIKLAKATQPIFVDVDRYRYLQSIKAKYDHPNFEAARNSINPFENLGRSIFMNRAGVKLANIDAIFNVTKHNGGSVNLQTIGMFSFCDLAGGPGSFTEYIQWRRPESVGFGITLRDKEGLGWNLNKIKTDRFVAYYGPDNTGNLYTNWRAFAQRVLEQFNEGVDLVVADGGFDADSKAQEFLSSRLILLECLTALIVLRDGGDFVCKFFDTVTEVSAHTLLIMALAFDNITLFKPISSRPANSEQYLVARKRRSNVVVNPLIEILIKTVQSYIDDNYVTSFIEGPLPEAFTSFLLRSNNEAIERQIKTGEEILSRLDGRISSSPLQYDTHKCFIFWNLP